MVDFVGTGMIGSVGIAAGWRKFFFQVRDPTSQKGRKLRKKVPS
jgi:hypothetical protein